MRELTLAEKLKRLRGDTTQKEAAKRVGISAAALCRLERGQRGHGKDPNHWTLLKVAEAYAVPVEYLESDLRTYMRQFANRTLLDPPLSTPGQRFERLLRELEDRFEIGADELANALGIMPADLDNYRHDRVAAWPSPLLTRLEQLVGVPPEAILHGVNPNHADVGAYHAALTLAARHGLPPSELERLVRLWITRDNSAK